MTEEEIGTKAIKFIDEHEEDCLTGFVMMRKFAYEVAKELEKENAELKEQNTNLQEMLKTERSVTCKEEYLKKVTELEQENAELKKTVEHYRKEREFFIGEVEK